MHLLNSMHYCNEQQTWCNCWRVVGRGKWSPRVYPKHDDDNVRKCSGDGFELRQTVILPRIAMQPCPCLCVEVKTSDMVAWRIMCLYLHKTLAGCFVMPRPLGGGIKRCCLTSVCLTSVCLCLSVAYIGPKSRTERPRKTKIDTEVAHVTRDSDTIFKVKRSKVKVTGGGGILWRPPSRLVETRTAAF